MSGAYQNSSARDPGSYISEVSSLQGRSPHIWGGRRAAAYTL